MISFKHILFHLHEKGLGRAQALMICARIQLQVHSSKTTPFNYFDQSGIYWKMKVTLDIQDVEYMQFCNIYPQR